MCRPRGANSGMGSITKAMSGRRRTPLYRIWCGFTRPGEFRIGTPMRSWQRSIWLVTGAAIASPVLAGRRVRQRDQPRAGVGRVHREDPGGSDETWGATLLDHLIYARRPTIALEYADGMTISGREVDDDLFARLRRFYGDEALVELTAINAWENASSKFNRALRIPSQGLWKRA
jgi:hypothetical protein